MWVAAVVVAAAVVEGEALVVNSTLGMVVVMTSLPRTQRMQSQSVAKLVLLPSTCVPVFDVVIGLILVLEYFSKCLWAAICLVDTPPLSALAHVSV